MAAKAFVARVMIYPLNKTTAPYPADLKGFYWDPSLGIWGDPILPPDQVPKPPGDWEIWPGPGDPDFPGGGIPIDPPPSQPPSTTDQVHLGWNWNDGKNSQYPNPGWYYVYKPGPGDPQPRVTP